jgi:hypothetical protein
MRFGRFLFLAMTAAAFLAGTARADFIFEFGTTAGVPILNGSTVPLASGGGTTTLNLYLRESVGGTVLSSLGLFTAAYQVTYDTPPGSGIPSGIAAVTAASKGPLFTFPDSQIGSINIGSSRTTVPEATQPNAFAFPDALNRVQIGTFTFTGNNPGSVNVTVQLFNPPAFQTGFNNSVNPPIPSQNIDSQISQALITINTTGVPEPTSLVLSGLGAAGFVGAVLRRRRAAQTAPVATNPSAAHLAD